MTRSRNWITLVCLLLMSVFVTLGGVSQVVHADSKYVVKKGNTLWAIAETHHTTVNALMKKNTLHTTLLQINQPLMIPNEYVATPHGVALKKKSSSHSEHPHITYKVHAGDTLWGIAEENHTTVSAIMEINQLTSDVIHPGQKLQVHQSATQLDVYQSVDATRSIDRHVVSGHGIPLQLISTYQAAGQKYGIPWTVLAAIHRTETNFSTGPMVSSAGAEGPMQFMPSTFRHFAVAAPGHGRADINNVYDAIYTAAHMLALDGYANNPSEAIYQYNHSMAYVERVESLAQAYQL